MMHRSLILLCTVAIPFAVGTQAGCKGDAKAPHTATGDHILGPTGPHGGHFLELEPSGMHAEWSHDDESHEVFVFLDDFEVAKLDSVMFVATIDSSEREFPLQPYGERWRLSSTTLLQHIDTGTEVKLVIEDSEGKHTGKIESHADQH